MVCKAIINFIFAGMGLVMQNKIDATYMTTIQLHSVKPNRV
jgi:hypothetical protein